MITELKRRYPQLIIQSEDITESMYGTINLVEYSMRRFNRVHPAYWKLVRKYIRSTAHLNLPGPNGEDGACTWNHRPGHEDYDRKQAWHDKEDVIPSLGIMNHEMDLSLPRAQKVFENAKAYAKRHGF